MLSWHYNSKYSCFLKWTWTDKVLNAQYLQTQVLLYKTDLILLSSHSICTNVLYMILFYSASLFYIMKGEQKCHITQKQKRYAYHQLKFVATFYEVMTFVVYDCLFDISCSSRLPFMKFEGPDYLRNSFMTPLLISSILIGHHICF